MSFGSQLDDYQLQLAGFEGPLDVLLRLIEKQQLAISDVSLVAVSGGFLRYVEDLRNPPAQLLADFARVAARLLIIKSRSLLPEDAEEQSEDSFDDLAAQLQEYQRARVLALRLQDSESRNWRTFPRSSQPAERPVNVRLSVPSLDRLQNLISQVRERSTRTPGVVALRRIVSVADMSRRILKIALRSHRPVNFGAQVDSDNRSEIVAGFIAVLSLMHSHRLMASQSEVFGDIYLQSVEELAGETSRIRG